MSITKRNWLPLSAYRASLPYCLFLLKENRRSEEHTSELQSLRLISYAVFCLKNKQASVEAVKSKDSEAAKAAEKARLEAEKEANKAKAEEVAKKKAELAAAAAAKAAEEAAANAPAEEAPAAESAE